MTNEIRRNESFSQDFQQPQPDNVLPYNLSSINPDPSQNYSSYPEAYNTADDKLSPIEPVARKFLFFALGTFILHYNLSIGIFNIVSVEPPKFTSPHVVATFSNCGRLVKVLCNDPRGGAPPTVEILETKALMLEDKDMALFPGPLVVGETHKNDVIQFCKSKLQAIRKSMSFADKESACLIWEYLILMIRQNGVSLFFKF